MICTLDEMIQILQDTKDKYGTGEMPFQIMSPNGYHTDMSVSVNFTRPEADKVVLVSVFAN